MRSIKGTIKGHMAYYSKSKYERVKVSIILPVYNVGDYVSTCIESLKAQSLREIEFIFIDDCSTDGSMLAVEEWAAADPRVRILRNEKNLGAGPSRNRGIEAARGDYLAFADPDDYMAPDFYELLYVAATAGEGHYIAKGSRRKVHGETGKLAAPDLSLNERIRASLDAGEPLYAAFTYEHQTALYHCRLFVDVRARYGSTSVNEDGLFLLRCCYQTKDIVIEERAVYYYVQRPGSATQGESAHMIQDYLDTFLEKIDFLAEGSFDQSAFKYLLKGADFVATMSYASLTEASLTRQEYSAFAERLMTLIRKVPGLECEAMKKPRLKFFFTAVPHIESCYIREAAKELADVIQDTAGRRGLRAAAHECLMLMRRSRIIPVLNWTQLWARTCRYLANIHNGRAILKRILSRR